MYTQTPPKQTKELVYHCPSGNEGQGVWRVFIESISVFIK